MNPGISAYFGDEAAIRLQRHYRRLQERMTEAQRAGDRRCGGCTGEHDSFRGVVL